MKRIILQSCFALTAAFLTSSAFAQVNINFNTCPSAPTIGQIKGDMQGQCWMFVNMDANSCGWNPGIEGDAGMVSTNFEQIAGLYSPVLQVPGSLAVGFKYEFNQPVSSYASIKLYLVTHNNEIVEDLATINVAGAATNTVFSYNNTFANLPSGAYKLYIMFGCQARVAIDQLQINVPFLYNGGCNAPPVAINDNITGNANRTATGQVSTNDYDPNGDYFSSYLIADSPDGTVTLNDDGTFNFVPNPGFAGTSTTFTYQICDNGFSPACGNIATATITFSSGMLPVRLADLTVSLNDDNDAIIRWTTTYEQGSDHFEIERSFDGSSFETVGTVKAAGTSFGKNDYSFTDRLRNSVVNKKDVYYRIRMVDVSNRAEVTKVLVLRLFRTSSIKMVAVSPNPVYNDINVQVQLKESAYVVMKVTDNRGVEITRKSIRGNQGQNVFSIDGTSKLKPGIYMLEVIINSNERMTVKLVKN
jgi:Bacterial Ig domain